VPQAAKELREDAKAPLLATEGFKAPRIFFSFQGTKVPRTILDDIVTLVPWSLKLKKLNLAS
jgi:hypothetical protein